MGKDRSKSGEGAAYTPGLVVLHRLFTEMKAKNLTTISIDDIETILTKYKVIK